MTDRKAVAMAPGVELDRSLAALEAQLIHVTGEGAPAFQTLAEDVRDNYLLGCAVLAGRCRELAATLPA